MKICIVLNLPNNNFVKFYKFDELILPIKLYLLPNYSFFNGYRFSKINN